MYDCVWEFGINQDLKHLEKDFLINRGVQDEATNFMPISMKKYVPRLCSTHRAASRTDWQGASSIDRQGAESFGNCLTGWKKPSGSDKLRIERSALGTRRRVASGIEKREGALGLIDRPWEQDVGNWQTCMKSTVCFSLNKVIDSSAGLCGWS